MEEVWLSKKKNSRRNKPVVEVKQSDKLTEEQIVQYEKNFQMKLSTVYMIVIALSGVFMIAYGKDVVTILSEMNQVQRNGVFCLLIAIFAFLATELIRKKYRFKGYQKALQLIAIFGILLASSIVVNIDIYISSTDYFIFNEVKLHTIINWFIFLCFQYIAVRIYDFLKSKYYNFMKNTENEVVDRMTVIIAIFGTIISLIALFK